jgi:hypothetical protein
MNITLALLAEPKTGGWPTYTAHLYHGLLAAGADVQLVRLGNKTEKTSRDFGRGITYRNVDRLALNFLASRTHMIVTALDKKHAPACPSRAALVVLHDPTELTSDTEPVWRQHRIVTIRSTNQKILENIDIPNTFIPHPYARSPHITPYPQAHAVAFSRLDWDKNSHIIAEANLLLPPDKQTRIHGTANTIYTHHKITSLDPAWERNYAGPWPARSSLWESVNIAASGRYAVDLSVISKDGGGTQYSFLEAFDAGTPLIIHQKWLTGDPDKDTIAPYVHAAVTDAETLSEALTIPPAATNPSSLLNTHDATLIAHQYINLIENP